MEAVFEFYIVSKKGGSMSRNEFILRDETHLIIKGEQVEDVQLESSTHGLPQDIVHIFIKGGGELRIQARPDAKAGGDPGTPVYLDMSYIVD